MKISKILELYPQTLQVLTNFSPHFKKLNNKLLRKTLASRVTVEQAAKIANVDLYSLLFELNKSINIEFKPPTNLKEEMLNENVKKEKPEILKNLNSENIIQLDVRPIIDSGKDPFLEIMSVVKSLKDDQVLNLINSFEPLPLYNVMKTKGFEHWTEKEGNVFRVFFYKVTEFANQNTTDMHTSNGNSDSIDYENVIEIDVRDLVPPEPMMKILENISKVDEKTVMVVHHHREPMMLYPKLEERGYEAVTNKINDNYYKVVITKKRK